MSDKDEKKFANLHYPGMAADPNEGRMALDPATKWRYDEQSACLGEDAQKLLLRCSAFVVGASPLGVRVAKKLLTMGFGRVGVFGEQPLTGASDLPQPVAEDKQGTLPNLSKWAKEQTPWAQFEPFREERIDRKLSDMARGFDFLIAGGDLKTVGETVALAREQGLPSIAAVVAGRMGWCASLPIKTTCENCMEVPSNQGGAGFYYPLLDLMATWIATVAIEAALDPRAQRNAFLESFDATHSPWMRETRELKSKPGCGICSLKA
jgi:hypothetical protein